jgi:hypothetical protein
LFPKKYMAGLFDLFGGGSRSGQANLGTQTKSGNGLFGLNVPFQVPDLGITEAFFNESNPYRQSQIASAKQPSNQQSQSGQVQGASTDVPYGDLFSGGINSAGGAPNAGSAGPSANALSQFQQQQQAALDAQKASQQQQLEQDYNNTLAQYDSEAGTIGGNYNTAAGGLKGGYDQAVSDVSGAQTQALNDISGTRDYTNQTADSALNQARKLANELQQRNNSQLSAMGISSSSVAEGLGEGLSRDTYANINNIVQNRDTTLTKLKQQEDATNKYYTDNLNNLKQNYQTQLNDLTTKRDALLNQLSSNKSLLANQKFQYSQSLSQQYNQALQQLNQQAQSFAANLQYFTDQKVSALNQVRGIAQGNLDLKQAIAGLSNSPEALKMLNQIGGTLNYNVNAKGQPSFGVKIGGNNQDDLFSSLGGSTGVTQAPAQSGGSDLLSQFGF